MKRRLVPSLLASLVIAAAPGLLASPAAAQTVSRPSREVVISVGKGQLVTLPTRIKDVWIASETVADVQVKSATQLYVFGKTPGETTVYANDVKGNVVWSATVRIGSNLDSVGDMLRLAMPDAKITVSTMNNTVLLTGTVASPEDASEAERLTKAFTGDKTTVITRLKMATPLQVNLQVRFAEVSRSLSKSLASNLTTIDGSGGFQFGIGRGRSSGTFNVSNIPGASSPLGIGNTVNRTIVDANGNTIVIPGTSVTPGGGNVSTLAGAGKLLGLNILATLDAGEQVGLVTTLSQPNLTAISGETASFLAGGEYPIPVSNGLGTTTIQYKKFGVSLAYTPTVLANGRISLHVAPEVSELSSQGAVTLNGFSVPSLTIRRADTTVELGSGQSFMIAGLMSNSAQNTLQKTPGAGDVPILGALFRSTAFQKGQSELVIIVTPYLVNPVDGNDIKLPTDGYQSPNDIQRIFGNMQHDGRSGADRPKPTQVPGTVSATPSVSALDAVPPLPAAAPAPLRADAGTGTDKNAGKSRKTAAADAAPGFSF